MNDKMLSALIVEDCDQIRRLMKAVLKREGIACTDGGDAMTAIEILEGGDSFDTILVDLAIAGGENGLDFLESVSKTNPSLLSRTVVVSETAHEGTHPAFKDYRIHGVLPKPFYLEDLAAMIREATRRKEPPSH
ncbi:MAG: response regulator [Thermoanaerobaculia bacterium]|nr:response regulator [Thermoanaerobaculia bacterium]